MEEGFVFGVGVLRGVVFAGVGEGLAEEEFRVEEFAGLGGG